MKFNHKENCFDTIRHVAALMVLFSHSFAIYGLTEPTFFGIQHLGSFAVIVFFTISGFLITKSYVYSQSNYDYLKKRFLRLFPGLIFCSFLLTYFYCGFLGEKPFFSWISSIEALKTFIFYSTTARGEFFNASSNQVIEQFAYYPTLNGPLWSLFFEIFDYLLVLILFTVFNKKAKWCFIVLIPSLLIQLTFYLLSIPDRNIFNDNYTFLNYIVNYFIYRSTMLSIPFFIGSLIYFKLDYFCKYRIYIASIASVFFLISIFNPSFILFYLISTPVLILLIGLNFKDFLIKGRFDYSYGIYIYAWPIQQFFSNIYKVSFVNSIFLSLIFTTIFAAISWHLIEKPFLNKFKNKRNISKYENKILQ